MKNKNFDKMDTKGSFIPEESLDPEAIARKESVLLKSKITTEYALNNIVLSGKLNPANEKHPLNTGSQFHNIEKNAEAVTVYDRLQRPVFEIEEKLNDRAVSRELNRIKKLMNLNAIDLDCICSYDDRTIYRFITEELFHSSIEDIEVPGITTHFVYEEFHPNHEHDLKKISEAFIDALLKVSDSTSLYNRIFFMKELINSDGHKITEDYFIKNISLFHAAWQKFENISVKFKKPKYDMIKKEAVVEGSIRYDAVSEDAYRQNFSGELRFSYVYDNYWCFYQVSFPGFSA